MAPIAAERIEIGISLTVKDLHNVSINGKAQAPKRAEKGINLLLSEPLIKRATWGIIKPIQLTVPHTAVEQAVRIVAHSMTTSLVTPNRTPSISDSI